jgi:neutral ceramidase
MVLRHALLLLSLLLMLSSFTFAADLRVGAAAVILQAADSMVIAGGIGPGKATGQEGQLRVTAVVIEKPGGAKVVVAAVDVLFLTRNFVDRALAEVQQTTGIPPENVLINATHTHMAPSITVIHGYGVDPVFVKRVEAGIVKAVQDANAKLTDNAKFLFHLGEEKTIGNNSRWLLPDNQISWGIHKDAIRPTGPFDPQLPVLAFRGPQDQLLALIYNHSTHTIGATKPGLRSPGFYGLAAQELERELGGVACFLEGASGSTHNIAGVPTAVAVTRLKGAVNDALKQAEEKPVDRLVSVKRKFNFTVRKFDEAVEQAKVEKYGNRYARNEYTINVFRDMRKTLAPHQGETRETWLQVMLVGDVAIVGVPAEYFTSLGVDIKSRSPFKHTIVAELANDWIGYLPDRKGHDLGGYQTWMGQHSYAEIGTGERVADEVVAMLNELRNR